MLPLLFHSAKQQWHTKVHSSDASTTGYAVCEKSWNLSEVQKSGRCSEWLRYRFEDTVRARTSALRPDALMMDAATREGLPRGDPIDDSNASHATLLREAPVKHLDSGWSVCFAGKWDHSNDMLRLEGHALVMSARHALRTSWGTIVSISYYVITLL